MRKYAQLELTRLIEFTQYHSNVESLDVVCNKMKFFNPSLFWVLESHISASRNKTHAKHTAIENIKDTKIYSVLGIS